jgi:xanthosine utilization system XapX-like protein
MLPDYPKRAERFETVVQLVLLMTALTIGAIYSLTDARVPDPDIGERLALMRRALLITGVSFLLAVTATFLRKRVTDPPLVWIWGALLGVASISWVLGCLIFLSSM